MIAIRSIRFMIELSTKREAGFQVTQTNFTIGDTENVVISIEGLILGVTTIGCHKLYLISEKLQINTLKFKICVLLNQLALFFRLDFGCFAVRRHKFKSFSLIIYLI